MENKLKIYKEKLIIENIVMAIGTAALLAVQFLRLRPSYEGKYGDFYQGFIAGMAAGLCLLLVICLVRNLMAILKEDRLKALYIKENDERRAAVCTNGRSLGASIFLLISIPGMVVAGYFSATVFFTMVVCVLVLSVCCGLGKLYYAKKCEFYSLFANFPTVLCLFCHRKASLESAGSGGAFPGFCSLLFFSYCYLIPMLDMGVRLC